MTSPLIDSPAGVMAILVAVVSFWFWLEKKSGWKIFDYLPPLIFIYATPVVLSNTGLIPYESAAYDFLRHYGLPIFICLMLIKVDLIGAIRIMGKGVFVMLIGTFGVVLGGFVAYALGQALHTPEGFFVKFPLPEDSWKTFGTLAGSWIGGTGNMTAAHAALEGSRRSRHTLVLVTRPMRSRSMPDSPMAFSPARAEASMKPISSGHCRRSVMPARFSRRPGSAPTRS